MAESRRHPTFEVKNIDAVWGYLSERNTRIEDEIALPGGKRFSIFDPFGNSIELLERI